jgi:hypothetical protein
MINLLPVENRKNAWREYSQRRLIAFGLMLMTLFLTAIILLTTFYFSSRLGWQPVVIAQGDKDVSDRLVYEQKLKLLRENLSLLTGQEKSLSGSSVFEKIAKTKVPGIRIVSFKIEDNSKDKPFIKLEIFASTRKIASDYIAKLRKMDEITDVVVPILTSDKNLNISIELSFVDPNK